ncbi:PadR family transcriptional regulator [Chloroflexota bacterium]
MGSNKNELVSLGLIYAEPCHAYAVDSLIRIVKVDQCTNFSQISIYSTLKRLESEGCITVKMEKVGNMPERNVYTITEKGKQRLLEEIKENILDPQINGNNFALAMLFCFRLPAGEAIEILEKRIEMLNNILVKLKRNYDSAAKHNIYTWKIFWKARIKNMETEIETTKEYIDLFKEFPDYYDKNILKLYQQLIQSRKK